MTITSPSALGAHLLTTRLELGESGVFAPGTPVAAEAVADGSGGGDGSPSTSLSVRLAHPPGLWRPASTSRPRGSSQVLGRRPSGPEPARSPPAAASSRTSSRPRGSGSRTRRGRSCRRHRATLSTPSKSRGRAAPGTGRRAEWWRTTRPGRPQSAAPGRGTSEAGSRIRAGSGGVEKTKGSTRHR